MTSFSYALNNDTVEVNFSGSPFIPARLTGHPDTWEPPEGGEIEIEEVEYRTKGKAFVDGKWIRCEVVVDVSPLLDDGQFEDIQERISSTDFNEYD
jgi:hypothetical protein